ncbi:MAG TPA: ABC transporter substrate-binding protein [Candidatus Acidoferrales bacterium]|nr:ABC transporter substrate-binding protein [Candidatus Acidoferrales bacterium]
MPLAKIKLLTSSISHMPLHFVFRDSGVAQKHGFELEVDTAKVPQAGKSARTIAERAALLLAGEYQFLSGLHHEPYLYRARGDKRLVFLAQTQNEWDDRLIVRPEITEPRQLEGRRILTGPAPCVSGNLRRALERAGVDASKVEFVFSAREGEGPESRLAVGRTSIDRVRRRDVDAANVDIPFDLIAKREGLNALELPALPVIHNTTICASTDFVKQNEETVLAFLKALIEAIHFFKTEKEKSCAILARELAPLIALGAEEEVEYLHAAWRRLLCAKPYPDPLAVWNLYDLDVAHDPTAKAVAPLETWDLHYVRAIDDSGFIDALYAQP